MTIEFTLLPDDILYEVAELLDAKDIANLRCVNKRLCQVFSANRVWKPLTKSRWFKIDDIPLTLFENVEDYCEYYRNRNRIDVQIQKTIENMVDGDGIEDILKNGWHIVNLKHDSKPILNELRRKGRDLSVRYYASSLLYTIRLAKLLKYLKELPTLNCAEELYFMVSYMDPAFDNLLPYREKIISKTIRVVARQKAFKEDTSNAVKVGLIACVLYGVIKKSPLIKPNLKGLEDCSILRFYAGESNGTKLMIDAIVQKIASLLGINCSITKFFLKVENNSDDKCFVSLANNKIRILSYSTILRESRSETDVLNQLLKPIPLTEHLQLFDDPIGQSYFSQFPLLQRNEVYKYSRQIFNEDNFITIKFFLDQHEARRYPEHHITDLAIGVIFKGFSTLSPFLLPYSPQIPNSAVERYIENTINHFEKLTTYELEPFSSSDMRPNFNTPIFKIGDVIFHETFGEYGIVMGVKPTDKEVFHQVFVDYGKITVFSDQRLEKIDEMNKDIYTLLTKEPLIGLFFSHYDKELKKFIPTKYLAKLFPGFN